MPRAGWTDGRTDGPLSSQSRPAADRLPVCLPILTNLRSAGRPGRPLPSQPASPELLVKVFQAPELLLLPLLCTSVRPSAGAS